MKMKSTIHLPIEFLTDEGRLYFATKPQKCTGTVTLKIIGEEIKGIPEIRAEIWHNGKLVKRSLQFARGDILNLHHQFDINLDYGRREY